MCFDVKNNAGDVQYKKPAIKCSPEIRSYFMIRKGGYILWVCAGLRCMIGTLFLNVFIAMGLITLLIIVLIKLTLLNVQSVPGYTKRKTAGQTSLND